MSHPLFEYFENNRYSADKQLLSPRQFYTKKYVGVPLRELPTPRPLPATLTDTLATRASDRSAGASPSLQQLSDLLYWSASEMVSASEVHEGVLRRPYPSGGGKYPLELYVLTDQHPVLGTSMSHYRQDINALEELGPISQADMTTFKNGYEYSFVHGMPVLIIYSYILERNTPKYGAVGLKLALLEAGHLAQNMYLVGAAMRANICALAGGDAVYTDRLLGLDGYNESTFYTVGFSANPDTL